MIKNNLLLLLLVLFFQKSTAQHALDKSAIDVLNYQVQLKPDILAKTIVGEVRLTFSVAPTTKKVILDCGRLTIIDIKGKAVKDFQQQKRQLRLTLSEKLETTNEIVISYRGKPKRGLLFLSEPSQMHTVYFTSEWMVCNDAPSDKATLTLNLILPNNLTGIASGALIKEAPLADNLVKYTWQQTSPTPAYTYGFAVGEFNTLQEYYDGTALNYYAHHHSTEQLGQIFQHTGDMLHFFEEKSGVSYFQNIYSQILMGNHYQEMSGLSVLKNTYGALVLADSTETNLIAHELAHQWWGNQITCENWGHFWLNEGFATFMSAAYNEYCFGQHKYQADIDSYYAVYKKIKNKGKDKPLVFKNWVNPSPDDRNLVYFKGAYVLHLLKVELGDQAFWKAIKAYSQQYFGQSVTTQQFQEAIETATNKNLQAFFDEWAAITGEK